MNIEEHFEDETPYIQLDGNTPFANGKPTLTCFLNKQLVKTLKKSGYECNQYMNVCFQSKKALRTGDTYTWKLRQLEFNVVLIGKTVLFVKGMRVYAFIVGIIE